MMRLLMFCVAVVVLGRSVINPEAPPHDSLALELFRRPGNAEARIKVLVVGEFEGGGGRAEALSAAAGLVPGAIRQRVLWTSLV